jgi:DGQHR domain-containing protein
MKKPAFLKVPALAFQQGKKHTLYTFAIEGAMLKKFADVACINRTDDNSINGYQRPEALSHISNIAKYLESKGSMMPNALVVAFDDVVKFSPLDKSDSNDVKVGTLKIPLIHKEGQRMPAWIVDGQQRAAALEQAAVAGFMVCVVGFMASSDEEQREQFMLVNSTKPLSRSLLYELLPQTHCALPSVLEKKRLPTMLLSFLNGDKASPFYKKIRTATNPAGIIQDNSVLRMLENSLSDGVLYTVYQIHEQTEEGMNVMLSILNEYWTAVSLAFRSAWDLSPKKSRLTHGAGIISMGFIMDAITNRYDDNSKLSRETFHQDLEKLSSTCRWTHGYWEFGPGDQRKWNEIQNTPTDIRILSNHLLMQYKRLIWSEALRSA